METMTEGSKVKIIINWECTSCREYSPVLVVKRREVSKDDKTGELTYLESGICLLCK